MCSPLISVVAIDKSDDQYMSGDLIYVSTIASSVLFHGLVAITGRLMETPLVILINHPYAEDESAQFHV